MSAHANPDIIDDNLVFMYDTDDGKSYKGEPTVNLITNSGTSNTGWVGYGWTGSQAISSDYSNTYEFTATNGWHNRTFDTGVTSGGTIYVSFQYKLKQQQTTQNQIFVLNGTHLGSYTNYIGNGSMSFEWQTFSGSFTANANSSKIAIGPRGQDSSGLTDIVYIRNLQVEQKPHATQFVNGTRSATQGLIDRTGTSTINISNVSFDSNAQITFDGTDDYSVIPYASTDLDGDAIFSVEAVIKRTGTMSNGGIWGIGEGTQAGISGDVFASSPNKISIDLWGTATFHTGVDYPLNKHVHVTWVKTTTGFSTSTIVIYVNGVAYTGSDLTVMRGTSHTPNLNTSTTGKGIVIGRVGATTNSYYAQGEVPILKVYNRALTAAEALQNFNATKSRFGL